MTTPPPFKITKPQGASKYLKMLIYGDYGVGKTYLAGTAAEVDSMSNVLLISAESGDLTLSEDKHNFGEIDQVTVTDFKTVAKIHDFLKAHCTFRDQGTDEAKKTLIQKEAELKGLDPSDIKEPTLYKTVILDSLTEIEAYCMYQLLGITDKMGLHQETPAAEFKEFRQQHAMVQRLVRAYRDLPMHVIFICGRTFVQDESKKMMFHPHMTGKLAAQVQGFMDVVGYLVLGNADDKGNIPRRLYIQPVGKFSAKCRLPNMKGNHVDNPTMKMILDQAGFTK